MVVRFRFLLLNMPELRNLFVVNKAGGLIYSTAFTTRNVPKLTGNDSLLLASTFHSLHAIASQISPLPDSGGIESLRTESFTSTVFRR